MTDTAFHARTDKAGQVIIEHNLGNLLDQHRQAIEEFMEARRQSAEAKRLYNDAADHVDEVKLDALAEMTADPNYEPGKNAEARKQQAEGWLGDHHGVAAAKNRQKHLGRAAADAEIAADHAKARVGHLELQIAARRSELDLIASFARGAS